MKEWKVLCTMWQILWSKGQSQTVTSSKIAEFVSHVARSMVISGILLTVKALHFTTRLDIEELKVSNGWIGGFKQQHSVVYTAVLGQCNSVDF